MSSGSRLVAAVRRRAAELLLVLWVAVPLLLSAPGRVPADTKLYLFLDPSRLIADSAWSWDARQFGGWVPHQNVGYLWPTGPWYWIADRLSVPDWIAHRLWIGLLFSLAGLGLLRLARTLGLGTAAALSAAVVYQLSPYVLPYVSRTSALLLPWALLPLLCVHAIAYGRHGSRRDLAAIGLLVASTGGLNATALLMVAPAPAIWLLHAARGTGRTIRRSLAAGSTALATSLWWLVGLWIQGRHGAPVLSYSETLPSTNATSTAPEVLRGLGYWLFYVRDELVALTSAAAPHQGNPAVLIAGLTLIGLGLVGWLRAPASWRTPLVLTGSIGVVLAVGAHPFDDPSPLWSLAVDNPRSAVSLALRSSTRAVPMIVLALALGVGVVLAAVARRLRTTEPRGVLLVAVLAVVNLPALVDGGLVDHDLDRPQELPSAWYDAARFLDDRSRAGFDGAVLLVGGMESAAYRWGYPVDAVLPGLTDKPFLARDWLPLGSAPHMDLLYALDDAFQDGSLDPAAIAPVARLLGADTVMVVNSQQFERFDTVRPDRTADLMGPNTPGLTPLGVFGEPTVNRVDGLWSEEIAVLPSIARPEIELWAVDEVVGARTSTAPRIVAADGTGIVEAAAAGLISGDELLLSPDAVARTGGAFAGSIVTDSDRRRARQWRGSQNVWGATESLVPVVEGADVWDARLRADHPGQTLASTPGLVVTASSYGDPLSYTPEWRPNQAVDGDPSTAWIVGGRAEGQFLRVRAEQPIDELLLRPFVSTSRIDEVLIVTGDDSIRVTLDDFPVSGRRIELPSPSRDVRVVIERTTGSGPVGFSEVLPDERTVVEEVTVADGPATAVPSRYVFTRWRADRFDRNRRDPEDRIVRSFPFTRSGDASLDVEAVVRLSPDASDAVIADLVDLGFDATTDSRLHGVPSAWSVAAYDGDESSAWISASDPDTPILVVPGPLDEFGLRQLEGYSRIVSVELSDSDSTVVVDVAEGSNPVSGLDGERIEVRVLEFEPTVSVDPRSGVRTVLPVSISEVAGVDAVDPPTDFDTGCRSDLITIDDTAVPLRVTGSVADALAGRPLSVSTCDLVELERSGRHRLVAASGTMTGLDVDRVVFGSTSLGGVAVVSARVISPDSSSRGSSLWRFTACADGCWFEAPFGWNTGWSAIVDGTDLGAPSASAAGRATWFLPPGADQRELRLRWTPQTWMWIGLATSTAAVLACLVALGCAAVRRATRRENWTGRPLVGDLVDADPPLPTGRRTTLLVAGVVALVVSPLWGVATVALVASPHRHLARTLARVGGVLLALAALFVVAQQFRTGAEPSFWWPRTFERAHRPTLVGVVLLAASALVRPPPARVSDS